MHLTNFRYRNAAEELVRRGWSYIPDSDPKPLQALQQEYLRLLEYYGDELPQFSFVHEKRPDGVVEPNAGFIDWRKESGHDPKRLFHFDDTFIGSVRRMKAYTEVKLRVLDFATKCQPIFRHYEMLGLGMLELVDDYFKRKNIRTNFLNEVGEALRHPIATSRSLMRLIHYQPSWEMIKAKGHVDKSTLSLLPSSVGGDLYSCDFKGNTHRISPLPGTILLIWGHKAVTLGEKYGVKLTALKHEARCESNVPRDASAIFLHHNYPLWDAPKV